jgi:hypothetical protein
VFCQFMMHVATCVVTFCNVHVYILTDLSPVDDSTMAETFWSKYNVK